MAKKMSESAAVMRYHTAAQDFSALKIGVFFRRVEEFNKVHKMRMKWEAQLAGAKIK